jgi:hypothetical protein
MMSTGTDNPGSKGLSADLLHAAVQFDGRIAMVVGAGCSLEEPTGLKLASAYSMEAHRQLVVEGVLDEGECAAPEDLSALASAVWQKHGRQSPVVERLPRQDFLMAQPNDGYLMAAALLRERSLGAILTLNFDLAMTAALGAVGAREVTVVAGPSNTGELGAASVIYLHRNVNEVDPEKWILRVEALAEEWQGNWEEAISHRVMTTPVVVFAGLGSPAAVLTDTVSRVRKATDPSQHQAYVVDPAEATPFQAALELPPEAHIRMGWSQFMSFMAERVATELSAVLATAGEELCTAHGWRDEAVFVRDLCERLYALGLVTTGKVRATWLLDRSAYARDDDRRALVVDLLLAIGIVERTVGREARFLPDGLVELPQPAGQAAVFLPVSGGGTLRWAALEPRVHAAIGRITPSGSVRKILVGGVQGVRPEDMAPPEDVVAGDVEFDIVRGAPGLDFVTVDEIRADPSLGERLVG